MSDPCSCPPDPGATAGELKVIQPDPAACPTNGKVGRPIKTLTLKAMLSAPLSEIRDMEYRFCPDPACPTAYYSIDGRQTFDESMLREKVYQKHPRDADVYVCYCFRHTYGVIRDEFDGAGKSAVIDKVNAGIRAGQCACDIRNPQGSCCLGNIRALAKELTGA